MEEKSLGDADERAIVAALALERLGIPYRFRFIGDGKTFYSVEVIAEGERAE